MVVAFWISQILQFSQFLWFFLFGIFVHQFPFIRYILYILLHFISFYCNNPVAVILCRIKLKLKLQNTTVPRLEIHVREYGTEREALSVIRSDPS
jgi:hypothetical protein